MNCWARCRIESELLGSTSKRMLKRTTLARRCILSLGKWPALRMLSGEDGRVDPDCAAKRSKARWWQKRFCEASPDAVLRCALPKPPRSPRSAHSGRGGAATGDSIFQLLPLFKANTTPVNAIRNEPLQDGRIKDKLVPRHSSSLPQCTSE